MGTNQLRETTLTEKIGPPGSLGLGRGADNSTLEKNVTKTEEATADHDWRKLLKKARVHTGLSSQ
jgi:hypothetical protein